MVTTTKQGRLLEALQKGQALTEKQISSRFQIANPRATVSDLRRAGYTVSAVRSVAKNGVSSTKYVLA